MLYKNMFHIRSENKLKYVTAKKFLNLNANLLHNMFSDTSFAINFRVFCTNIKSCGWYDGNQKETFSYDFFFLNDHWHSWVVGSFSGTSYDNSRGSYLSRTQCNIHLCLWQYSGRSSGVSTNGVKCVFAHSCQVLLAEPEERRSFMDIRLLLARGDIGEAKSLPSTCIAGLSASWLSRHEPVGEGWSGGRRKDRDQRGHIHTLNSSTSQMWHLITGLHLAWVCKLEYEIHIGLKWGK